MPLSPYTYRLTTPPSEDNRVSPSHSRHTSSSSFWSQHSSPDSANTPFERSPVRQHAGPGPILLPKVRTQDLALEPSLQPSKSHRRALSSTCNPPGTAIHARPAPYRSTTSPPECVSLISPISATSSYHRDVSPGVFSATESPITLTPSFRRRGDLGHARSTSASSIDDVTLGRYGYPYRGQPVYTTAGTYRPSVTRGCSIYEPPSPVLRNRLVSYNLPEEQQCNAPDEPTMTLNEYLRNPNPQPNIVRHFNTVLGRGLHRHFWWDIRNLRAWDDFTLEGIMDIPSFPALLDLPVNASAFPKPFIASSRLHPESEAQLTEIVRDFYMMKINAALKVTTGAVRYMAMRVCKDRDGPQFISNYQDDREKTLEGNGRGRVVGLVKSFERWNTGMRLEAPHRKVLYLEGLSNLHHHMREHQCRYGFIITETELVCARAATDDNDTPYFGALELVLPIETREQEGLTASLALWYLHMLAKDEPLPGQSGWKLSVGAPAENTRKNTMEEKDRWIPDPQLGEKRDAKRVRGWTMPTDPYNRKKESGRTSSK
jgi:hypothetical protein